MHRTTRTHANREGSLGMADIVEHCEQTRLRIRLSVAAYAYELENVSIMTDHEFDALCLKVDTSIATGNRQLDTFFKRHFEPASGFWVRKHPEQHKLAHLLKTHYGTHV
jgi:hypothetical protein